MTEMKKLKPRLYTYSINADGLAYFKEAPKGLEIGAARKQAAADIAAMPPRYFDDRPCVVSPDWPKRSPFDLTEGPEGTRSVWLTNAKWHGRRLPMGRYDAFYSDLLEEEILPESRNNYVLVGIAITEDIYRRGLEPVFREDNDPPGHAHLIGFRKKVKPRRKSKDDDDDEVKVKVKVKGNGHDPLRPGHGIRSASARSASDGDQSEQD